MDSQRITLHFSGPFDPNRTYPTGSFMRSPHALDRLSAAFLNLARYRTRENLKPQAARCGFLLWLAPLKLMQKSLRQR